jgi:hypothetical protein
MPVAAVAVDKVQVVQVVPVVVVAVAEVAVKTVEMEMQIREVAAEAQVGLQVQVVQVVRVL